MPKVFMRKGRRTVPVEATSVAFREANGWRRVTPRVDVVRARHQPPEQPAEPTVQKPPRNAAIGEWQKYAESQGLTDYADLTRDDLRDLYAEKGN